MCRLTEADISPPRSLGLTEAVFVSRGWTLGDMWIPGYPILSLCGFTHSHLPRPPLMYLRSTGLVRPGVGLFPSLLGCGECSGEVQLRAQLPGELALGP